MTVHTSAHKLPTIRGCLYYLPKPSAHEECCFVGTMTEANTAEPLLKDHPFLLPEKFGVLDSVGCSFGDSFGFIDLQSSYQKHTCAVFQDRWSPIRVVSHDKFRCTLLYKNGHTRTDTHGAAVVTKVQFYMASVLKYIQRLRL